VYVDLGGPLSIVGNPGQVTTAIDLDGLILDTDGVGLIASPTLLSSQPDITLDEGDISRFVPRFQGGEILLFRNYDGAQDLDQNDDYILDQDFGEIVDSVRFNAASDGFFGPNSQFLFASNAFRLPDGSGKFVRGSTSQFSNQDTPGQLNTPRIVFINEINYDNDGSDPNEFIEVAGSAGLQLAGYTIVLYNGDGGTVYETVPLDTVTIDDEGQGVGAVAIRFPQDSIENGAPDGIALVDPDGTVLEFISYEGSFTAVDGAAAGMTSIDIGVAQSPTTPEGQSLQLRGLGSRGSDFTWTGPATSSLGKLNANQVLLKAPPQRVTNSDIEDVAIAPDTMVPADDIIAIRPLDPAFELNVIF